MPFLGVLKVLGDIIPYSGPKINRHPIVSVLGVRGRNRPLRVGATLGEATEPSGASAEGSGVGVQSWSWRDEVMNFIF